MEHKPRAVEGGLLLFAALVVLLGFALGFTANLPELRESGSTNVNTAPPADVAAALTVDPVLAQRICDFRETHGSFANTAALCEVKVLSPQEAESVAALQSDAVDLKSVSARELSARAEIGRAAAESIVEALAARGARQVTALWLAGIPVVSTAKLSALDPRIRVRDAGPTAVSYWVHVFLFVSAFFMLHAVLRRRGREADPYILPCTMLLCGIGAVVLFSMKDPLRDTDVFSKQVHGVLLGAMVAMVPFSAKFRALRPWRYTYVYAMSAILLTALLAVFGTGPGGARLKLFGFQPVEVVKIALVFFVASYLADRWMILLDKTGPKRRLGLPQFRDVGPLAVMYLLSLATFLLVRDLGPMLILFGMFVIMLYVATGKPAFVGVGVALVGVTGWTAHALRLGVFHARVGMWLHPWQNPHPNGMQLGQGLWGLGTGGIWGSGVGLGRTGVTPRAGSDLIFASLGEELGLVGLAVILVLYSVIVTRGLRIVLHARTDFERFLGAGLSVLLGIQTVIIVFGVLGLIPLTGVTLPFAGYGKSSLTASFLMLGLLLGISAGGTPDADAVRDETRRALRKVAAVFLFLLLGVAGVGRLVWIQGIDADHVAGRTITVPDADGVVRPHVNPRLKLVEASIPRGSIYDRNGKPVASSGDSAGKTASRPGRRYYPYGRSMVHLIGYTDPACGGPVGLEKGRNNELRGFNRYSELLPVYRLRHTPFRPRPIGKDVRLTLDGELQATVEKALRKYAGLVRNRQTGKRKNKGAAVVLDVYTGEVLAAVSIPNFDPNGLTRDLWRAYNEDRDDEHVLVNRALNGLYPPGSTFKLVTAACALENGFHFTCTCSHRQQNVRWRSDGRTWSRKSITDLEEMRPHGATDLGKAIRASCNVYFGQLGIELGADRLCETARYFGLRHVPPPGQLVEDLPDSAYGQGRILVTPLDMARVVAAIANGGVMMKPQFVKDIREGESVLEDVKPVELGRPIGPETAASLCRMMADVTTIGTGRGVFSGLSVAVAGKTGSAENEQADHMPHSWFVGFAPAEDPRIAFAVVIENGGYGRSAAGPVCREIVKAAL